MDGESRPRLNNQKIPGTYEYKKHKALRRDYGKEVNIWGKKTAMTKQEAHEFMLGRMPGLWEYGIPRELGERIDMTPTAKLVYGVLRAFRRPRLRLYLREIGGLCGLDTSATSSALYDLEAHDYIRIIPTYYTPTRRGPSVIQLLPRPNKKRQQAIPSIMKTNITNIEDRIRARFYDA